MDCRQLKTSLLCIFVFCTLGLGQDAIFSRGRPVPLPSSQGGTGSKFVPALGFVNLPNVANAQIYNSNTAAGDNDLYTVPAGKRAIAACYHFNPSLMTSTIYQEVKIGGTYYKVTANQTPNFDITGTTGVWGGIVLEAGQSLSVNEALGAALALTSVTSTGGTTTYTGTITNGGSNALAGHSVLVAGFDLSGNNGTFGPVLTSSITTFTVATTTQPVSTDIHAATWQDQTGVNFFGTVWTFDNTGPLKSSVVTTFVNGNNTVYTCCAAGKTTAYAAGFNSLFGSSGSQLTAGFNNTGGTLTYSWNFVQNGGSVSSANQVFGPTATNSNVGFGTIGWDLNSGDFISLNTTSTSSSQIAWITVWEQ